MEAYLHGYRIAFIVTGALLAAAVVALLALVKTPKSTASDAAAPYTGH